MYRFAGPTAQSLRRREAVGLARQMALDDEDGHRLAPLEGGCPVDSALAVGVLIRASLSLGTSNSAGASTIVADQTGLDEACVPQPSTPVFQPSYRGNVQRVHNEDTYISPSIE